MLQIMFVTKFNQLHDIESSEAAPGFVRIKEEINCVQPGTPDIYDAQPQQAVISQIFDFQGKIGGIEEESGIIIDGRVVTARKTMPEKFLQQCDFFGIGCQGAQFDSDILIFAQGSMLAAVWHEVPHGETDGTTASALRTTHGVDVVAVAAVTRSQESTHDILGNPGKSGDSISRRVRETVRAGSHAFMEIGGKLL